MSDKRGRPRDQAVRAAILTATGELLTERGYERLSVEAIAGRAGVGKQTIYRWWRSKAAVVCEAVAAGQLPLPSAPPPDTGELGADLRSWMREQFEWLAAPGHTALVRALAAASSDDAGDTERLHELITGPSREHLIGRLRAGAAAGRVRADADLEAAADALLGAVLYRVLARAPIPPGHPEALVDVVVAGLRSG